MSPLLTLNQSHGSENLDGGNEYTKLVQESYDALFENWMNPVSEAECAGGKERKEVA